jgi:predicted AAA+ superfamily ATPase
MNTQFSVKIECMHPFKRKILPFLLETLERGKGILLLGARQTGKTTLILEEIKPDLSYSLIQPEVRLRYEKNPSLLGYEIIAEIKMKGLIHPVIAIDEVQKVPLILDVVQDLIDRKIARFVLTGSSARKLKHGPSINLLPGRVVLFHLDPLLVSEIADTSPVLENLLLFGTLPGIYTEPSKTHKNQDLETYVKTYLEEEVRAEALVRNVSHFAKFLYLAAIESGNLINLSQLSQSIGVAHTTIATYFQILEDCLIVERIEPLTISHTRHRLSKAAKFLFFDLGIRRLCAEEGALLPLALLSRLFEQFVGLEIIRQSRFASAPVKVRYWRDHSGPEIDYVIEHQQFYVPVEVKWTDQPTEKDCRHLKLFLNEYTNTRNGYIICRTPRPYWLGKNISVLPWQHIHMLDFLQ